MTRPALGPEHMKTYAISAPVSTHFRPASCEDAQCAGWTSGWVTRVLPGTAEHDLVLSLRGRYRFTGPVREADGLDAFTFAAGQPCFRASQHRVPLEREPLFVVRGGDHRGNPRGITSVTRRAADWVDDFATHQQNIATAIEKG
jgi:hypothetical protein